MKMDQCEKEKLMVPFNIELVKKHIKNLIAGNGVSNKEMYEMYKSIMDEQIKKRIEKHLIGAHDIKSLVEKYIKTEVQEYVHRLTKQGVDYWNPTRTVLETMIHNECKRQIDEIIKVNLKISFKNVSVEGMDE